MSNPFKELSIKYNLHSFIGRDNDDLIMCYLENHFDEQTKWLDGDRNYFRVLRLAKDWEAIIEVKNILLRKKTKGRVLQV